MNRDDQVIDPNQVHNAITGMFKSYENFIKKLHDRKKELIKEQIEVRQALEKNLQERLKLQERLEKLQKEDNALDKLLSMFHGKKVDGKYLNANKNEFTEKKPSEPAEMLKGKEVSPKEQVNSIFGYLEMKKGSEAVYDAKVIEEISIPRKKSEEIKLSDNELEASFSKKWDNFYNDSLKNGTNKEEFQQKFNDFGNELTSQEIDWAKRQDRQKLEQMTNSSKSKNLNESFSLYKKFNAYLERVKLGGSMTKDLLKGNEVDQEKWDKFVSTLSEKDQKRVEEMLGSAGNGMPNGIGDPTKDLEKRLRKEGVNSTGFTTKKLNRNLIKDDSKKAKI